MTMQGKAIDVVIGELDKLAMCKRGALDTEKNERSSVIRKEFEDHNSKEPKLTKVERNRLFSKNRKRMLSLLKFRKTKDITYVDPRGEDLFVHESLMKFKDERRLLFIHPDHKAWETEVFRFRRVRKTLNTEMEQRMAILDDDFKKAKMNFISEVVSLKDFQEVYDKLEIMEW